MLGLTAFAGGPVTGSPWSTTRSAGVIATDETPGAADEEAAPAKKGGAAIGADGATAAGTGGGPGGPGGAPVPTLTGGASGILAMCNVSWPAEIVASVIEKERQVLALLDEIKALVAERVA